MVRSKAVFMLAAVLAPLAVRVLAGPLPGSTFAHGYWTGGAYADVETGNFSYCAMHANLDAGNRIVARALPGGAVSFGIVNDGWRFHQGDLVRVVVELDELREYATAATVVRESIAALTLTDSRRLLDKIVDRSRAGTCRGVEATNGGLPFEITTFANLRSCAEKYHAHASSSLANKSARATAGNMHRAADLLVDYGLERPAISGVFSHPRTPIPRKFGDQRDSIFAGEIRIVLPRQNTACTPAPEWARTTPQPRAQRGIIEIDPIEISLSGIGPVAIDRIEIEPIRIDPIDIRTARVPPIEIAPILLKEFVQPIRPDFGTDAQTPPFETRAVQPHSAKVDSLINAKVEARTNVTVGIAPVFIIDWDFDNVSPPGGLHPAIPNIEMVRSKFSAPVEDTNAAKPPNAIDPPRWAGIHGRILAKSSTDALKRGRQTGTTADKSGPVADSRIYPITVAVVVRPTNIVAQSKKRRVLMFVNPREVAPQIRSMTPMGSAPIFDGDIWANPPAGKDD